VNDSATTDLKNAPRRVSELAPHSAAGVRLDRLPPHSIEAEQGVLGCLLLSPNDCIGEVIEKFKAGAQTFYDLRHETLYTHLVEMFDAKIAIDLVTVAQRLKDRQLLDACGGLGYLSGLPDMVPSAANLQYYTGIVFEKFLLRQMLRTCQDICSRVYEYEGELDQLMDEAETSILQISGHRVEGTATTIKDLVNKAIAKIEEFHQNQGALTGLGTGLIDFDKMTTGLHAGDMVVIAARPSIGKTSLAMNVAEYVALDLKQPVGVFSLEMTSEALVLRMLCSRARVNMRNIRDGFLAERDFPKLTGTAGKLSNAPLYIDDSSGLSILQLRAKARRMWQQYGIKLFVIDYLQLLHSTSRRCENRQQEIAEISGGIKGIAKELKVPVIVLAQLNRELEKRGPGERPRMSDLRESGSIEQDADIVGLLYKDQKPSEGDNEPTNEFEADAIAVKLFIAKQRNGPVGEIDLTFLKSITRFESAARIKTEDVPQ
jgi:replicative DNA helicase